MIDLANLPRMATFAVIVREGSLTGAARVLGISKASVSEQLAKLELTIGARLVHRTTRRISVTEAGDAYYHRCARLLEEAEAAMVDAGAMQSQPTGTLRLTAPHAMGATVVIPAIVAYCKAYPAMRVDLQLSDTTLDLLEHGLDLAIRGGWPESSSLVARKLGVVPMYLCAAPEYVAPLGAPAKVADLVRFAWVLHAGIARRKTCTFRTPHATEETAPTEGNVLVNSADAVRAMLLGGHGIGVLPLPMVQDDLRDGRLVQLLTDHALAEGAMYAVYPSKHHISPKVQRFVDVVVALQRKETPTIAPSRKARRGPRAR